MYQRFLLSKANVTCVSHLLPEVVNEAAAWKCYFTAFSFWHLAACRFQVHTVPASFLLDALRHPPQCLPPGEALCIFVVRQFLVRQSPLPERSLCAKRNYRTTQTANFSNFSGTMLPASWHKNIFTVLGKPSGTPRLPHCAFWSEPGAFCRTSPRCLCLLNFF